MVCSYVCPSWACLWISWSPSTAWWKSNTDTNRCNHKSIYYNACSTSTVFNIFNTNINITKVSPIWDDKSFIPSFQTLSWKKTRIIPEHRIQPWVIRESDLVTGFVYGWIICMFMYFVTKKTFFLILLNLLE